MALESPVWQDLKTVPFYFDYQSPYSYLGWKRMEDLRQNASEQWQRDFLGMIDLRPVPMGTLIHSYGSKGPAEIPAKRDYLTKVWLKKLRERNLHVTIPKLPFNYLCALRLSKVEAWSDQQTLSVWDMVSDLFSACWERGEDIGDEEVLQHLLTQRGMERSFLDRATQKEARRELKENVKTAQEQGVFGVPTWVVGGEIFWGDDSFEDMMNYLSGQELYDPVLYEEFNRSFRPATEN